VRIPAFPFTYVCFQRRLMFVIVVVVRRWSGDISLSVEDNILWLVFILIFLFYYWIEFVVSKEIWEKPFRHGLFGSFEDELCKLLSDYLTHSCIAGFVNWNSLMSTFVCLFIFVNDVLYLIVSPWIWGRYIHKYEYVFSGGTFCCTYTLVINHDLIYYLNIFEFSLTVVGCLFSCILLYNSSQIMLVLPS